MQCQYEGCKGLGCCKCACVGQGVFFCVEHLASHANSYLPHPHELGKNNSAEYSSNKFALIKTLQELLERAKLYKKFISDETIETIQKLQKASQKAIEELAQVCEALTFEIARLSSSDYLDPSQNYLDSLIVSSETHCTSEISQWKFPNSLLNIEKIKSLASTNPIHSIISLKSTLNSLFTFKHSLSATFHSDLPVLSLLGHHLSYYNYKITFNPLTNFSEKSEINLSKPLQFPLSLNLSDQYLFIAGGRFSDTEYSGKCYLYHTGINQVICENEIGPIDHYTAAVVYKWDIFLFGGKIVKECVADVKKYCLVQGKIEKVLDLPRPGSANTPLVVGEMIVMTGFEFSCMFYYAPEANCYGKFSKEMNQDQNKAVLKYKTSVFLLYDDQIYENKDGTIEIWEIVGIFKHPKHSIKEVIERSDAVYFRDYGNLFKMNPATKEITCILNADYLE